MRSRANERRSWLLLLFMLETSLGELPSLAAGSADKVARGHVRDPNLDQLPSAITRPINP
jgi:hypothetical protein